MIWKNILPKSYPPIICYDFRKISITKAKKAK